MAENQSSRRTRRERISRIVSAAPNEIIIEPKAKEIQIDIDGYRAAQEFNRRARLFARFVDVSHWTMRVERSRSRKPFHFHVTVKIAKQPLGSLSIREPLHGVLVASLLGSDSTREIINYARVTENRPYPICFFRAKNVRRKGEKSARSQRFGPICRA